MTTDDPHSPFGAPPEPVPSAPSWTQPLPPAPPVTVSPPYGSQQPYGQQPYGQQPYVMVPMVQSPGTNGLAVASMVLGIVWLCGVGSILAVIFGHVALNQIKQSHQDGRGMAIAGLVLGYIGVSLFVLGILLEIVGTASSVAG